MSHLLIYCIEEFTSLRIYQFPTKIGNWAMSIYQFQNAKIKLAREFYQSGEFTSFVKLVNSNGPILKLVNSTRILYHWWQQLWRFFWDTPDVSDRDGWLVKADTLVQNYVDGGIRALHPHLFAESLRLTWIRRLLDPTPQVWKNLVWEHLNHTYAHLHQGELLLTSSLDFSQLPTSVPPFFRQYAQ